jgi:hypothetical protein
MIPLTEEELMDKAREAESIRILTDPNAKKEFKNLPYYEFQ